MAEPFLRHVVRICGYIPNARAAGREYLRGNAFAGRSVVLFPEGSRSPEQGLRPFSAALRTSPSQWLPDHARLPNLHATGAQEGPALVGGSGSQAHHHDGP